MIEIESGCIQVPGGYNYTTITSPSGEMGDVKITSYFFITLNGEEPDIGDFIENGVLKKRTTLKINSDWSKWKDKDLYGNP